MNEILAIRAGSFGDSGFIGYVRAPRGLEDNFDSEAERSSWEDGTELIDVVYKTPRYSVDKADLRHCLNDINSFLRKKEPFQLIATKTSLVQIPVDFTDDVYINVVYDELIKEYITGVYKNNTKLSKYKRPRRAREEYFTPMKHMYLADSLKEIIEFIDGLTIDKESSIVKFSQRRDSNGDIFKT